jgi:hypothetical protein
MARKFQFSTDSESEYQLIGIACALRDYRMAFALNKDLWLDLAKKNDFMAEGKIKADPLAYSFYYFEDATTRMKYCLISNKSGNNILVPELRQADYFLFINGMILPETLENTVKTIRGLSSVVMAFKVDIDKYKKLDTLFSDIELHTIPPK